MTERSCRCEGCSRMGWVMVRLPEPLYRLTCWAGEWIETLRVAPPFSRRRRELIEMTREIEMSRDAWREATPFLDYTCACCRPEQFTNPGIQAKAENLRAIFQDDVTPAPSPCSHGRRFCEECHGGDVL